jgi:molecular chaperone HscA
MGKISINIATGSLQKAEMIVGIDLGTTNSLVAIIHPESNKATALKEHNSSSLVPSIIHFDNLGNPSVGESAKEFLINEPQNTIFSAKRLMGKSYHDIESHADFFTYKVIDDKTEKFGKSTSGRKILFTCRVIIFYFKRT